MRAEIKDQSVAISVLRLWRPSQALLASLDQALATPLPREPNRVATGAVSVAWLAPGEWALFCAADDVRASIAQACAGSLFDLSDVSAGRRQWHLRGPWAQTLLAQGCTLDLHPSVFGPGHCAQTLFAQIPVLIRAGDIAGAFDVIADVSFTAHVNAFFDKAQGMLA